MVLQAMDFTAPRGRLEMGGLLIGHVGRDGVLHVVTGFFPEQIRASPGYCEFDGSWVAIAASACARANHACGDDSVPDLRVIGWIHTHPDLGLFLSSIDVATYSSLRGMIPDSRFVAVVIDPLRYEDGIFPSEHEPRHYQSAMGTEEIAGDLRARYHLLIDFLQETRKARGKDGIPAILPGDLHAERMLRGDADDAAMALRKGFQRLKSEVWSLQERVGDMGSALEQMRRTKADLSSALVRLDRLEEPRQTGILWNWFGVQ